MHPLQERRGLAGLQACDESIGAALIDLTDGIKSFLV